MNRTSCSKKKLQDTISQLSKRIVLLQCGTWVGCMRVVSVYHRCVSLSLSIHHLRWSRISIWLNDIMIWRSNITRQRISQSYYRSSSYIFDLYGTLSQVDDSQTSFCGAMMGMTIIGGQASCGGLNQSTRRL